MPSQVPKAVLFRPRGEKVCFSLMVARIKTHIWAAALIRRAQSEGAFVYVAQKGDPDGGIALIKVRTPDGQAKLYAPERNFEGERGYRCIASGAEREIDEKVQKRARFDPDLWAIEIEDREGRTFLTEALFED